MNQGFRSSMKSPEVDDLKACDERILERTRTYLNMKLKVQKSERQTDERQAQTKEHC